MKPVVCAVAALILLGACGKGNEGDAAPSSAAGEATAAVGASACDIVTEADAEKAFGRDVERLPSDGGPAGLDICQYGYQGERLMDSGNLSVTVQPVDFASVREGVTGQGYKVEPVPGLGDQAFWSNDVGLYVGKGNRTAIYLFAIGGQSDSKEATINLAKATVARL